MIRHLNNNQKKKKKPKHGKSPKKNLNSFVNPQIIYKLFTNTPKAAHSLFYLNINIQNNYL
jgi:hypothetical protein